MRSRAPRHRDEDAAYRDLRARLLGGPCEVCPPLIAAGGTVECTGTATELHHLRKQSSSGAKANPANVRPSCHNGNQAVEKYPPEARAAGLVIREGDPEWDDLSSRTWRLRTQEGTR